MRCEEEEARAAVTPARRDRAAETVWQEAADLGTDLAAAIEAACAAGALSGLSVMVLYLVYVQGTTLEEAAERLQVSYDQARRLRRRALQAIRDTGLLDGYAAEKDPRARGRGGEDRGRSSQG